MKDFGVTIPLSFTTLIVQAVSVGEDYNLLIWGGEKPHIGCIVLAVPRPSLSGDGSQSATSSVLNRTGHKDEQICRCLAEALAAGSGQAVACCGGVHTDHITAEQIKEAEAAAEEFAGKLRAKGAVAFDMPKEQGG